MLHAASTCPLCSTGTRGFRLSGDSETVVVMCDECDSVWIDARRLDAELLVRTEPPHFLIPGLLCSLSGSRWATRKEVERAGWSDLIAGEGVGLDGGQHEMPLVHRRWDAELYGPISEEAARALFLPAYKYRVSVRRYPPGTSFGGASRAGTCIVLRGACRRNDQALVAGDILDAPAGEYDLEVIGLDELVLLQAWELPPEFRPPNA